MPNNSISFWQKVDLLPAILESLTKTLYAAVLAPFRGADTPKTFKRYISGSTESNYMAWTKSQKISPRSVVLPESDTKAFWLGDPDASTILLYYHGGGWAMEGSAGHFIFVSHILSAAKASGKSLGVLLLQYDLAPAKHYPFQLRQSVELLRYALQDLRKTPDQIVLGGDSAGGNMVFGILSHILHPHAEIDPLKFSAPIKAAFAASPVASFNSSFVSELQDPAPTSTIKEWLRNVLGPNTTDRYNDPSKTDAEWWKGLETAVKEMLITVAASEMMADDTKAFAATLKAVSYKVTLFSSQNDFHAEPAIGPDLGFEEGEASKLIKSWVAERL